MNGLVALLDEMRENGYTVRMLATLAVGTLLVLGFLGWIFRKNALVKRLWSMRQGIFNGFVVLVLAGCVTISGLTVGQFQKLNQISLQDISDVEFYQEQVNLYDPMGCENFFYDYDGNHVDAQNGSVMSNWIPCSAGQMLTRNGIATNVVCYFDENRNFLQRVDSYGESTLTVPDDDRIAYVRMAVQMSDTLKIVYGDQIADVSIAGGYYSIPKLKIDSRNLLSEAGILESPDGKQWKIMVDEDGNLFTQDVTGTIQEGMLPSDFPEYEITGSSLSDEDYLISMYGMLDSADNYIFVMSPQGRIKWYKKVPFSAYNFRKIQYSDGTIRYAYQQKDRAEAIQNIDGGMHDTHIVLMDENFQVIRDDIRPIPYGSLPENTFCENHDYKILGDDHYLLTSVTLSTVENIPGMEGTPVQVVNAVIQEQKDGQVIMQWESIDHPQLYEASLAAEGFSSFVAGNTDVYTDYVHINAIAVDPNTYDLLISCRSVGLMKIDRLTGDILWMMGREHNDIQGLALDQIGLYQHDVRYLEDGSITIFDNSGGEDSRSRVCRYWLDEQAKTLLHCETYLTEYKSSAMGSAELVDEKTQTYLINYGMGVGDVAFEERDFSTNTTRMSLKFKDGQVLYRVFRGVETTPVQPVKAD